MFIPYCGLSFDALDFSLEEQKEFLTRRGFTIMEISHNYKSLSDYGAFELVEQAALMPFFEGKPAFDIKENKGIMHKEAYVRTLFVLELKKALLKL